MNAQMYWTSETVPLSRRRLFQSNDLDEARAIVAGKFCDHRLDIASAADRFDACHHRVEGRLVSLNYIRYGADVTIRPGELGSFYLIQIPLTGAAQIDNRGGKLRTSPGLGSVLNPHRDTKMRWHEGCSQVLLQIDADALNRRAEELTGRALRSPVTFETAVDERRKPTAEWVQWLRKCFVLADQEAIFAQRHVPTQLRVEDDLITGFLRSQPSNVSSGLDRVPSAGGHANLRRAVRFIEDHLCDPLSVADIAEAAGATPRSLQLWFGAQFDQSPMQYLRERRLRRARQLLEHLPMTTSIAEICQQVGISHSSRFAGDYRALFGESPSETRRSCLRHQTPLS